MTWIVEIAGIVGIVGIAWYKCESSESETKQKVLSQVGQRGTDSVLSPGRVLFICFSGELVSNWLLRPLLLRTKRLRQNSIEALGPDCHFLPGICYAFESDLLLQQMTCIWLSYKFFLCMTNVVCCSFWKNTVGKIQTWFETSVVGQLMGHHVILLHLNKWLWLWLLKNVYDFSLADLVWMSKLFLFHCISCQNIEWADNSLVLLSRRELLFGIEFLLIFVCYNDFSNIVAWKEMR